jgi:Tfp pilus assembly protein PilN
MLTSADTLNVDPEQQEAPRSGSSGIVRWLLVLSLGCLLAPLFLIGQALQDNNVSLQAELDTLELTLTSVPPPDPQEEQLRDSVAQTRQLALELEKANLGQHINWSVVMAVIGNYDQTQLQLVSLSQTGNRVVLSGRALDESAIMNYTHMLEESALFMVVNVRSISLASVPTATPRKDLTPTPEGQPLAVRLAEFVILLEVETP